MKKVESFQQWNFGLGPKNNLCRPCVTVIHNIFLDTFSNGYLKLICMVKFIYSEKATKFYEIFPLLLTVYTVVKSKGNISRNFVAFSEYMNFRKKTGVLGFKPNNPTDWKLHELNLMIPYFLLSYNLLIFDMNQKAIKI